MIVKARAVILIEGRLIQSGDVNLYLFYLFVVVVIAYAVYAT